MDKKIISDLLESAENDKIERIVVGAFIEDGGKILILERPSEEFMGGIFELPSGKLEQGEDLTDAVIREIKEETNLDVFEIISFVDSFDYTSGSGKKVRQFNFYVKVKHGDIKLTEHLSYAWATIGDKEYQRLTESVKRSTQTFYKLMEKENEN